jgi:ATP-dependent exoDNAse (exonuclease V) alpha subunit
LVVNDDRGLSKTLAPSQRLFVHGYAVTSYASQGKTADTVIVADAGNRAATNRQQWYVSISRGRRRVVVLTPNESELRENIQRSGTRELALEESPPPAQTQCEVMAWRMRRQQVQRYAMMQQEFQARQRQEQQIRHHL